MDDSSFIVHRLSSIVHRPHSSVVSTFAVAESVLICLRLEHAHKRQVAVYLVEVEAVPDHELVGYSEAHVVNRHVNLPLLALVKQCTHPQAGWIAGAQAVQYVGEGEAAVY